MLIKEETIQTLKAQHQESVDQQEEHVKKIQTLEETITELKNEISVLNEKVGTKSLFNLKHMYRYFSLKIPAM